MKTKQVFMGLTLAATLLTASQIAKGQEILQRTNGTGQNTVVEVKNQMPNGSDNYSGTTADIDFKIWDDNVHLNIPQARIGLIGATSSGMNWDASGRLGFYTSTVNYPNPVLTERMRITENGNIGIGTTNPVSLLHVNGDITGKNLEVTSDEALVSIKSKGSFKSATLNLAANNGTGQWDIQSLHGMNSPYFLIKYKGNGSSNIGCLGITSNGTIEVLNHLKSYGTISAPRINVDGTAYCEEIVVDLSQNWPDFVFEDNYRLSSLKETERFINENKHLPGVPSAKEMEQNGLNVSEMQHLHMMKIEELTLHTIEQQKQIDSLKSLEKKNQELSQQVANLENLLEELMATQSK